TLPTRSAGRGLARSGAGRGPAGGAKAVPGCRTREACPSHRDGRCRRDAGIRPTLRTAETPTGTVARARGRRRSTAPRRATRRGDLSEGRGQGHAGDRLEVHDLVAPDHGA